MRIKIVFVVLFLILKRFCDMCVISGEKCACKMNSIKTEMNCLEKFSNPKILNLNEIVIMAYSLHNISFCMTKR